jgi:superoxide reductase
LAILPGESAQHCVHRPGAPCKKGLFCIDAKGGKAVMKFYICEHCGNIITYVKNSGVPVVCCGEPMKELVPGAIEASLDKHKPVIEIIDHGVIVRVGKEEHPMIPEHYIEWIALQTKQGTQIKHLQPGDKPEAFFAVAEGDWVDAVYAYCNIHGLWSTEEIQV